VKDKKIIAYKTERVKKIAFNLRTLIQKAVMDEWSRLGKEQKEFRSEAYRHKMSHLRSEALAKCADIEDERSDLYRALGISICLCSGCSQTDGDMVYNVPLKEWYCTDCAQEYREYYQKEKTIYGDLAEDADFYETFL